MEYISKKVAAYGQFVLVFSLTQVQDNLSFHCNSFFNDKRKIKKFSLYLFLQSPC